MRVAILSFGSNWWARSESQLTRFARYNSSGIACGSKMRRHWIVPGVARFNGISNFNSSRPERLLGSHFRCSEFTFACGGNRLLFMEMIPDSALADFYLLTITSARFGRTDLSSPTCRSGSSFVLAASQLRERQEIMLLLEPGGWFQTSSGLWQLRHAGSSRRPEIVLLHQLSSQLELPL